MPNNPEVNTDNKRWLYFFIVVAGILVSIIATTGFDHNTQQSITLGISAALTTIAGEILWEIINLQDTKRDIEYIKHNVHESIEFIRSFEEYERIKNMFELIKETYSSLRKEKLKDIHGFYISDYFFLSRIEEISNHTLLDEDKLTLGVYNSEAYKIYRKFIKCQSCDSLKAVNSVGLGWWENHYEYVNRNIKAVEEGRIGRIDRLFILDRKKINYNDILTLKRISDDMSENSKITIGACFKEDVMEYGIGIRDSVLYFDEVNLEWESSNSFYDAEISISNNIGAAITYHNKVRSEVEDKNIYFDLPLEMNELTHNINTLNHKLIQDLKL
jgi:hypothetical protein